MTFVDTGAFLALHRKTDQNHGETLRLWPKLDQPMLTSNHIVDELATLLGRLAGFRYAADRIEALFGSGNIDVLYSSKEDEIEALRWMRKYADKNISFTDCVSFAMMRRHRIRTVFTFDRHFRDAGFQVIPDVRAGRRG